jgi:predicted RNA binding protein YcfA (HicA-like mRNA interferase family)
MRKLPRDVSGAELCKRLQKLGYQITRQAGSHLRLTTMEGGQHHLTVPNHDPVKLGTLSGILNDVAKHFQTTRDDIIRQLFEN